MLSKQLPHVILASQSLQRAELLRQIVPAFEIVPANIDERAIDDDNHARRAKAVAQAKGRLVADQFPTAIVISADTFVVFGVRRFEKPTSKHEAIEMLQALSGKKVDIYTGISLTRGANQDATTITAQATFRKLDDETIQRYCADRQVTDWAGGFSIRDVAGLSLLSEITGSISAVLGLPLEWLQPRLPWDGKSAKK